MGSVRKVNYAHTWEDQRVISMYRKLKACVDDGLKMKKQGARKRLCLPRDLEPLVREIFLKKRGITFRNDIGGCEPAPNSDKFPEADWSIKGWFDAAKICVNVLLKSDYKRATSHSGGGGGNEQAGGGGGGGAAEAGAGGSGAPGPPSSSQKQSLRERLRQERAAEAGAGSSGAGGASTSSQKQSLRDGFRVSEGAKENRKRPLEHEQQEARAWPLPSQHGHHPQGPQSYAAAASADASGQQQQQQPRIKLPRMPSFGASSPRAAREPFFDSAEVGPSDERVPVHALTTWGAARMVEEALRKRQPSRVHWGAHHTAAQRVIVEGLTGQDLIEFDGPELAGFIKGPAGKQAAVASVIDDYRRLGGVSRVQLREWGQVTPGQPLPAASSEQAQREPSAAAGGGGGIVSRNGWGAPLVQPKRERP